VHIHEESSTPPPLLFDCPTQKRRASDDQEEGNSEGETAGKDGEDQRRVEEEDEHGTESEEAWEEELDETLTPNAEIRDWEALRTQIKADLKKKQKSLLLSEINQWMILRNFTNLHLKGCGRIEASFEITWQWQEKDSSHSHFAQRICALAQHYQILSGPYHFYHKTQSSACTAICSLPRFFMK